MRVAVLLSTSLLSLCLATSAPADPQPSTDGSVAPAVWTPRDAHAVPVALHHPVAANADADDTTTRSALGSVGRIPLGVGRWLFLAGLVTLLGGSRRRAMF